MTRDRQDVAEHENINEDHHHSSPSPIRPVSGRRERLGLPHLVRPEEALLVRLCVGAKAGRGQDRLGVWEMKCGSRRQLPSMPCEWRDSWPRHLSESVLAIVLGMDDLWSGG